MTNNPLDSIDLTRPFADPWKDLRKEMELFGNVEPSITLDAATMPIGGDFDAIETLPAIAASVSYGSTEAILADRERALRLNRTLIELEHGTPLEAIQFNFLIQGISRKCGAQLSRYRVGQGHVSSSRRYRKETKAAFVYPGLANIKDEATARTMLREREGTYEAAISDMEQDRNQGMSKDEANGGLPITYASDRYWWVNVRALRHFFHERMSHKAEWETRRITYMLWNFIAPQFPSLFEDLVR